MKLNANRMFYLILSKFSPFPLLAIGWLMSSDTQTRICLADLRQLLKLFYRTENCGQAKHTPGPAPWGGARAVPRIFPSYSASGTRNGTIRHIPGTDWHRPRRCMICHGQVSYYVGQVPVAGVGVLCDKRQNKGLSRVAGTNPLFLARVPRQQSVSVRWFRQIS